MLPLPRWAKARLFAPLRSPRFWAVLLAVALCAAGLLVALRKPLADRLWPDSRIQQLLVRGDAALARGELSAADGSGARELYAAALALDSDRSEARDGLARTGAAAAARARADLAAARLEAAAADLALARALQVPQAQVQPLAEQLRLQQARHAGLDALLQRARQAQRDGRLDGEPDAALPLYQRILALAPERTAALEGREDALTDLLQHARMLLARGDLAGAAPLLAAARGYDAGHADLPESQAEFNRQLDRLRAQGETQLRRGQLAAAAASLQRLLQAQPDDAGAQQAQARLATTYATEAARLAADFHFEQAEAALQQARQLAPEAAATRAAAQALERARLVHAGAQPKLSGAARERRLRALMRQMEAAETAKDWLTPPGASAYDRLREAQALAPQDPRVLRAVRRIVPATRDCFEDELRGNRLRAARVCLDAWQAVAPRDASLGGARRRLAQRWIAVGSERLRAEDVDFAQQALGEARRLDPATPELDGFAAQVGAATLRRGR